MERFEDLSAWQRARALNAAIYQATKVDGFQRDPGLAGQIRRASVWVMGNIAEGFERNRDGEFHQFLSIAKGSCAEVRSHLYAALDAGYLSESAFNELRELAEETTRVIAGLRASVARRLKPAATRVGEPKH